MESKKRGAKKIDSEKKKIEVRFYIPKFIIDKFGKDNLLKPAVVKMMGKVGILILALIFISCSSLHVVYIKKTNRITEKAYICTSVFHDPFNTLYIFENLSRTGGLRYSIPGPPQCIAGDTIIIKEYKVGLFGEKQTVFINKN